MTALHGLRILITRPAIQTKDLAAQTLYHGGVAMHFPTLEIIATKNIKKILLVIRKLKEYDFVIFISPNSVFNMAKFIHSTCLFWPEDTKTIAIGPGTTSALKQCGLPSDHCPEKDFSGTGLLNLAVLLDIKQKKILIVKGENGRHYLVKSLKTRGALVDNLNVYKRQLPKVDKTDIPNQESIDVIIGTSHSGLKNLVSLLYPYWQDILFKKQLLVISSRLANSAKKLGFVKPPLISDNATNTAILQTLFSWREQSLWNHSPQPI